MSRFIEIQRAILGLGPGEYQRLCSAYAKKKYKFENMHDIGSKEGTNKTTIGIPDSYSINEEGKYILLMYGTVEKQTLAKLTKDIKDACNSKKTGITQEKIKEIICFHTNTNISPGEYEHLLNLVENIKITLIDIDSVAHDIEENYPSIANDYLQISIDTNQISDIDTFVERYDKAAINSPLNTVFIDREEKDKLHQRIKESKMTIISGKPGIGKTRIAIEVLREFQTKDEYIPLCVRANGLELYNDMKTALEGNEKYIVFIDDINNIKGIQSVIDMIVTNKNENIKVLATVRGYLLREVIEKIERYIELNVFALDNMDSSKIIEIMEKNYDIKNKDIQTKVLGVCKGNPRLAIMSIMAIKAGKIESLNSVYDVFRNYYEEIFRQKKLLSNEINVLFYISVLSPISTSNEKVKKIFEELKIYNVEIYRKLRDMELIDYYNEDALKICDQNLANYIIYKYLIVDKIIKVSDLLKQTYPKFIVKIVDVINMINDQFYNEDEFEYIIREINDVWKEEPYNSDWQFIIYFHNVNITKSLAKIKAEIDGCVKEQLIEEVKYTDKYEKDEIIDLLTSFASTEYSKIGLELLFAYLEKKPNLYNAVCKSIKENWLIKNKNTNFALEKEIIDTLYSKYKAIEESKIKEIYKVLLEQVLMHCLQLEFSTTEKGTKPRSINIVKLKLLGGKAILSFRRHIYDILIELLNKNTNAYEMLLNSSNYFFDDEQKEILQDMVCYMDKKLFCNWDKVSIIQSQILFSLSKKCRKLKIKTPKSLEKYNMCSEFLIIKMLEEYDYEHKNDSLLKHLKGKDQSVYNNIFYVLKKVEEENIKVDNWKIGYSINILFEYVLENDMPLFERVFDLYIMAGLPFVNGMFFTRKNINKSITEKMLDKLIQSNTTRKYNLLSMILNNYYDKKYLNIIKGFIDEQKDNEYKYTISLESLYEYSKFDNNLLEEYTNKIIDENNIDLCSSFTNSLLEEEFCKIVYKAFVNQEVLQKLYLYSIKCHTDYKGELGYLLSTNNEGFLAKILEQDNICYTGKVKNIVSRIWENEAHSEIISNTYSEIISKNFGYLRVYQLFDAKNEKNIITNQLKWFKEKILEYKEDKNMIYNLFYVICEKEEGIKKELILFLIDNTNDVEIFKRVNFFSHSESWSETRIPLIEKKVEFIQTILDSIKEKNDMTYIYHIEYLEELINSYEKEIKKTQIEEYLDDFIN